MVPQGDERTALAQAGERNLRAYTVAFCAAGEGQIQRGPDATLTAFPHTYWVNGVVSPRLPETGTVAQLDRILTWFRELKREVWVHVGPYSEPADLAQVLRTRSLHNHHNRPMMVCDFAELVTGFPLPEGVTIEPLDDYHISATHPHPILRRANTPRLRAVFSAKQEFADADPRRTRTFVAWLDDKPVGVGIVFLSQGNAGIYDVEVLEPLRGRGIGTALLQAICVFARDQGAGLISLAASEQGAGFYPKFGFFRVGRWPTYTNSMAKQRRDSQEARP